MSEVMIPELANLLDLAEVVSVIESLNRRVLGLQHVITTEQRQRRDLMAHLAVEQVEHAELAARVAMLETSMAPPWADAGRTCPRSSTRRTKVLSTWPGSGRRARRTRV